MQILDYLQTTGGILWLVACLPLGVFLAWLAVWVMNKVPASWLCDYGETPAPELLTGSRVSFRREGILLSVLSVLCLALCRVQFNQGFDVYFIGLAGIIFFALMIAVCDLKYMIIPDQFTAAVGIIAVGLSIYDIARGFRILHFVWWSPLLGAVIGAGAMLLIDFIGMLVYKKEGMGFGDVKLFAAVGLLTGFPGTVYAFLISLLTATVCFLVILAAARRTSRPAEAEEETEESEQEILTAQSYLAFGPYITVALIGYIVLFDAVHFLANSYLELFHF